MEADQAAGGTEQNRHMQTLQVEAAEMQAPAGALKELQAARFAVYLVELS
jgi:hypothetical protein